jgi:rhodanese-related sulfurtransferase
MFGFLIQHPILVLGFFVSLAGLLFLEFRRSGPRLSPLAVVDQVNRHQAMIIDLRDKKDFDEGHITRARHIPYASLGERWGEIQGHVDKPVIFVCKMGQHSGAAVKLARKKGAEWVGQLSGGVLAWQADQLPLVKD